MSYPSLTTFTMASVGPALFSGLMAGCSASASPPRASSSGGGLCEPHQSGSYASNPTVCAYTPYICNTPIKKGADVGDPVDICQRPSDFPTALAQLYSLTTSTRISSQNTAIVAITNAGRVRITEFSDVGTYLGDDQAYLGLPVSVYKDILRQSGRMGEVPLIKGGGLDCLWDYPSLTFLNVARYVILLQATVCPGSPTILDQSKPKDSASSPPPTDEKDLGELPP